MRGISRKRISLILIIYAVIFSSIGGSLAYLNWESNESQNTEIVFTLNGDFSCAADIGGNINPENIPLAPSSCTNSTHAIKRELIIKPTIYTDKYVYMDLWLDINSIAEELSDSENFKYALTTSDNSCTDDVIVEGSFNQKIDGDKINLFYQKQYTETTEETYYLYIWLDAAETNINTAGKSFDFTINGTCSDLQPEHTVTFDPNGGVMDLTLFTTVGETEYTVPADGTYKLELWGAQGGDANSTYIGGYGGYSVGTVNLEAGTNLYVNVGGQGSSTLSGNVSGGYNGGGAGYGSNTCSGNRYGASGGGATHIATVSGQLYTLENYKGKLYDDGNAYDSSDILIVAGGGGGAHHMSSAYGSGSAAGGYIGHKAVWTNSGHSYYVQAQGGTQTSGGTYGYSYSVADAASSGIFGAGGTYSGRSCSEGSGGGGGYYGGGSGQFSPGGGGSGYIGSSLLSNKAMYCYNCTTSSTASTLTYSTTNVSSTPTANYAKSGNGAAKITQLTGTKLVTNSEKYGVLPTPTRSGYTFASWNTSSDGTGETITSETIVNLDSDQTLYAKWTPGPYTISYNANGGSGAPSAQTKEHDVTLTLSSTVPTKSGYTFLGWSTSSTATSATYSAGGNYTANSSTTLYAVWEQAILYLYNAGNTYDAVTGGWKAVQYRGVGEATLKSNYMYLKSGNSTDTSWYVNYGFQTKKTIDVTNYSKIRFKGYAEQAGSGTFGGTTNWGISGGIWDTSGNEIAKFDVETKNSNYDKTVNISNITGSYYVKIFAYVWNDTETEYITASGTCTMIYLE